MLIARPSASPRRRSFLEQCIVVLANSAGIVLACTCVLLSLVRMTTTPPFGWIDEVAHVHAIMHVLTEHTLPEVHFEVNVPGGAVIGHPGDPRVDIAAAKAGAIPTGFSMPPYESTQPPLYYVVAALLASPFAPDPLTALYVGRLTAALFAGAAIYFLWAALRQLRPRQPAWAVVTAGVIMLMPQFAFSAGTATNDTAVAFGGALTLYVWFRALGQREYDRFLLKSGAALGLALLAKLTAVALVPGLVLLLLYKIWPARAAAQRFVYRWRSILGPALGAAAGVLIVIGWWLVRNYVAYGEITGAHNTMEYYQKHFARLDWSSPQLVHAFLEWTWHTTLGPVGWPDDRLPNWFYVLSACIVIVLLGLSILATFRWMHGRFTATPGGSVLRRARTVFSSPDAMYALQCATLILVSAVSLLVAFIQFNTVVGYSPQGRYFLVLLLAIGVSLTSGLYSLFSRRKARVVVLAIVLVWFALTNALAIAPTLLGQP